VASRERNRRPGVYDVLGWWQSRVNDQDAAFNLDFDPREAIRGLLRIGATAMNSLQAVDIDAQAVEFEKGFWAKWCELYGFHVTVGFGGYYYADERVPKEGEERLVALLGSEAAAEAFVNLHGAASREAAQEQATELNSIPLPRGPLY
jgi:hypothetical protein